MAIEVAFRGVMLFERKGSHLARVLLPLAEPDTVPRDSRKGAGFHADDSVARPHYTGLGIYRQKSLVHRFEPLRGTVTIIEDGQQGKPCDFPLRHELAQLAKVVNGGKAPDLDLIADAATDFAQRVAARVMLNGGRLVPSTRDVPQPDSSLPWRFTEAIRTGHGYERHKKVRLLLRHSWLPDDPARGATIVLDPSPLDPSGASGPLHIRLAGDDRAFIYDIDKQEPKLADLDEGHPGTKPELEVDDDFKWLYQLLHPKHGSRLTDWLDEIDWTAEPKKRHLPAPIWVEPETGGILPEHPNVSTCFPGSWP